MRTWMAAWTVGAMAASGATVSAQEAPEPRTSLTVTVHVTDYARLSPEDLASAQAHATRAYRAAGLDIVWSSAPWLPGSGPDAKAPSIDVRLVILPRDMAEKKCRAARLGKGVMGTATSGASEAGGRIASVFYDRIARAAQSQLTPVARGLGHVIAHEVGHLLIGGHSHTDEGLMRPNWNPEERGLQTFTASQVQTIRHRFTITSAH